MESAHGRDAQTPLARRLAGRIAQEGALPFDVFMASVLYDEEHGYYAGAAGRLRAGILGDFATAPTLTPLFGAALARFAAHAWHRMGAPSAWMLLEPGGGTGALLAALLRRLAEHDPAAYAGVRPVLVDVSAAHRREAEARLLAAVPEVPWIVRAELGVSDVPVFAVANELLDDQPVRLLERDEGTWWERLVGLDAAGRLAFTRVPAPPALVSWVESFGIEAPDRHVVEVPVGAFAWLDGFTRSLADVPAVLVLLDYGEVARDLLGEPRPHGTLLAYEGHVRDRDVLLRPGSRNLTTHVNWSAIARHARALGWDVVAFTDQFSFLSGLGALEEAARLAGDVRDEEGMARLAALKEVLLPTGMGESVKALVLTRGFAPRGAKWPGLDVPRALEPRPRA